MDPRLPQKIQENVTDVGALAKQIIRGSKSNEVGCYTDYNDLKLNFKTCMMIGILHPVLFQWCGILWL